MHGWQFFGHNQGIYLGEYIQAGLENKSIRVV